MRSEQPENGGDVVLPDVGHLNHTSSQYFLTGNDVTSGLQTGNFQGGSDVDRLIWKYCSPPIFVLGIVGNVLTVLVTSQRPTRHTSSGVYLLGMSLGAIGVYLVGFLSQWLRACGFVDFVELGPWWCRWNKFLYYSCGDVAIWLLTLLTVDRLIAVCFPLRKIYLCTRYRAVTLCCVVASLAVFKNFHIFWTRGTVHHPRTSHCGAAPPHDHFENFVRPWIVFAAVTLLPVVVIIVCNTLIIRELARGRHLRRSVGKGRRGEGHQPLKPRTRMTTMMCIVASSSFIVFNAPSILLVVLKPYYPGVPYDIAKAVNNLLVHVNYAANFFLYCLGGRSFRMRLKFLLARLCCRSKMTNLQRGIGLLHQSSSSASRRHRTMIELNDSSSSSTTMKRPVMI